MDTEISGPFHSVCVCVCMRKREPFDLVELE
jgi:hypothetical protein